MIRQGQDTGFLQSEQSGVSIFLTMSEAIIHKFPMWPLHDKKLQLLRTGTLSKSESCMGCVTENIQDSMTDIRFLCIRRFV